VLPFLLAHPHLQIIINGAIPSSSSHTATKERLHQQLAQLVPGYSSEKGSIGVGFVRADKALSAIDALGRGIGLDTGIVEDRSDAIQRFQHDFTASNFGPLQARLSAYLSGVAPVTDLTSPPANFQVETAKTTLGVALTYISNVVLSSSRAARAVLSSASDLRTEAHRRAEHARQNSVVSLGISSGIVQGSVEQELAQSEREVRALMGQRLGWSKLILGAVDDVGEEVAAEVQKCFGRGLEERVSDTFVLDSVLTWRSWCLKLANSRCCTATFHNEPTTVLLSYLHSESTANQRQLRNLTPSTLPFCSITSKRLPSRRLNHLPQL
jgi:hypothetical protein